MADRCEHLAWSFSSDGEEMRCQRCGTTRRVADDIGAGACLICRQPVVDCLYTNVHTEDGRVVPMHDLCAEAAS